MKKKSFAQIFVNFFNELLHGTAHDIFVALSRDSLCPLFLLW